MMRDLAIANAANTAIVDEIREIVGLKGKPGDVVEAVRKLVALRDGEAKQPAPRQPAAVDGCHCGTCTCNPNMTPAVRFDLSPAQQEGAIREHLIRLGWTPPDEHALSQPAEGEEIMVNTPYDVFILPLRPSGLDGKGPRFVVHVPGPEQPAAEVEALRADAERWRALREMDGGEIYALLGDCDGIHPEQADAAIDQARGKAAAAEMD